MNYEPRQSILDLLDGLEVMYGEPRSAEPLKVAAAWHVALELLTCEQIERATPVVLRMKCYGWPKASDLIEAATGRLVKIPRYATDHSGSRILKFAGGPLVVDRWHEIRIPLDWKGDAGALDFESLPEELITWNENLEEARTIAGGEEDGGLELQKLEGGRWVRDERERSEL